MPRKDPVTGCMVMTLPEFLAEEAEREGKGRTGGDIFADIMMEMEDDSKRIEDEMRKPEHALELIHQAVKDAEEYWNDDEDAPPIPNFVEVVWVREARVSQSFSSSGHVLRVEAKDADGKLYYVTATYSHWSGTRLDPPEDDLEFYFAEFRPHSEHPWKCFVCNRTRAKGERHWSHLDQSNDTKKTVHACPRCNGYEREQNKRRLARRRAATLRKARK